MLGKQRGNGIEGALQPLAEGWSWAGQMWVQLELGEKCRRHPRPWAPPALQGPVCWVEVPECAL